MLSANRIMINGALMLAFSFAASGCGNDPTATGTARVQVLLTDAPSDFIESAEIWVSRVYLQGGGEDNAPRVYLYDDPENPKVFDLMELRDGITGELTEEFEVAAGNYSQLRIIVDSARVTLIDGLTFNGGSSTRKLTVPSGSQSGIKVQLAESLDLEDDEVVIVLVDFDVNQNFVIQGNPGTPAGINGIIFTPVLHEKSRQETGQSGQ
jgi:hypothetical protein